MEAVTICGCLPPPSHFHTPSVHPKQPPWPDLGHRRGETLTVIGLAVQACTPCDRKRAQYGQVPGTRPSVETHESECFWES
eukprot:8578270-Pyramimonas_sp.AAC.2